MNTKQRLSTLFSTLALLLGVGVFAACESEEPNTDTTVEDVAEAGDEGVFNGVLGAREVYEDSNPYLGQTVTVSGEIAEIYGTNAFKIGEDLWGEDLLVVVPQTASVSGMTMAGEEVGAFGDLDREYVIQVTGTVRQYVLTEVETEYGLDLDPTLETEVEEQEPMIVAESIQVMTEEAIDEALEN